MKKIKLILFFFVLMLINNLPVSALTCEDISKQSWYVSESIIPNTTFQWYWYNGTKAQDVDFSKYSISVTNSQEKYISYCRNAGISHGSGAMKCFDNDNKLLDNATTENKKAYDYGLIKILKNGYSNIHSINYSGLTNDEAYIATTIAIRAYEMLWSDVADAKTTNNYVISGCTSNEDCEGSPQSGKDNNNRIFAAPFMRYANSFLDDATIQSKLRQATNKTSLPYMRRYDGTIIDNSNNTATEITVINNGIKVDRTSSISDFAKKLVIDGLDGAIEYRNNGSASIQITRNPALSTVEEIKNANNVITGYRYTESHTLKLSNFNHQGSSVKLTEMSDLPNGVKVVKYIINDVEYTSLPTFNLVSLTTNGTGNIDIKIVLEAEGCKNVKYSLNYSYFDQTISNEAFAVTNNSKDTQKFYVLVSENATKLGKISKTNLVSNSCPSCTTLEKACNEEKNAKKCEEWAIDYPDEAKRGRCNPSCTELQNDCNSGNQEACNKWATDYPEQYNKRNCVNCLADISDLKCSQHDKNLTIREGYEGEGDCNSAVTENIKKCVLGANDVVGNSYLSNLVVDNNYCSVYCKEDIDITMPGDLYVSPLRNLDLNIQARGTKTCYSTLIDTSVFKNDVSDYATNIGYLYNEYLYLYNALNNRTNYSYQHSADWLNADTHTISCTKGTVDCECNEVVVTPDDPKTPKDETKKETVCTKNVDYDYTYANGGYTYKYAWSFVPYTLSGSFNLSSFVSYLGKYYTNVTCSYSGGRVTCTYLSEGSDSTCSHDLTKRIHRCTTHSGKNISDYISASDLTSVLTSLKQTVSKLSKAISDFDACTSWNNSMDYNFNPEIKFDYEEQLTGDTFKKNNQIILDTIQSSKVNTSVSTQKCASDTDDAYNSCVSGWSPSDKMEQLIVPNCKTSGGMYTCSNEKINISQTLRMKASITSGASYRLDSRYTNLYYTGNILLNLAQNDILNGHNLNNIYPVGADIKGSYDYSIIVSNLGEYYNNPSKLGRIWGDDDSVYKYTLDKTSSCRYNSALKEQITIDGVTHDEGVYACEIVVSGTKHCEKEGGYYFCKDGNVCDRETFELSTECGCAALGNGRYRLPDGSETDDYDEYMRRCPSGDSSKKCKVENGQHYCTNGKECTEDEWKVECTCYEDENAGKYYCVNGTECGEEQFEMECPCPDCPTYCPPGEDCEKDTCTGDDCPVDCPLCLYNEGLNVHSRPISPNDINPNDRELGANWNSGQSYNNNIYISTSLQLKAYATTTEIVKNGNSIYDVNNTSSDNVAIEVTMDSEMINFIKNYNSNKSYTDNSLKCYDYTADGKTYKNVFCYSTFLDTLISEDKKRSADKQKIKITGGTRIIGANESETDNLRKSNSSSSDYWKTWDKVDRNMFKDVVVTTTHTIEYHTTKFGYDSVRKIDYGIGPSWK